MRLALEVHELDRRTKDDLAVVGHLRDVDDLRVRELGLDLLDTALGETLLLLGGVVFGVLLEVAMLARLGDRLDDARPVLCLETLQLGLELLGAARRKRHFVHLNPLDSCSRATGIAGDQRIRRQAPRGGPAGS